MHIGASTATELARRAALLLILFVVREPYPIPHDLICIGFACLFLSW